MEENEELARLLAEAKKGNKPALGALLAQLRPWVRRLAQGLFGGGLRAWLDGSDIVSEVHLRVFERFDQFRGDSVPQLRAWIKTILRRIIADHIRNPKEVEEDGGHRLPDVPADGTTPSQRAIRNEDRARLSEALQGLPEEQRLVFCLRFYDRAGTACGGRYGAGGVPSRGAGAGTRATSVRARVAIRI